MSKHARFGPKTPPTIDQCLFHRCERHDAVKQLNAEEETTRSECGACVAEAVVLTRAQLLLALDGYAERMEFSHRQQEKIAAARARLNLLSPGAGNFLDEADDDREAET